MSEPSQLDPRYVNAEVVLPYGLEPSGVESAVSETYRLIHGISQFLLDNGYRRLEELILGNSLSGIVSEFLVKNIARCCPTLEANLTIGGHPDLLPKGHYDPTKALRCEEGLEVKASIQKGGWQGHNPEACWVMVFRYVAGRQGDSGWIPFTFVEILCAQLDVADWSFSGRKGSSRRTPTASITRSGVEKLRRNFVYRVPGVGIGKYHTILAEAEDQ